MASKLNSSKSNLTIITQKKLCDLTLLSPEKPGPQLIMDFKIHVKQPKSVTCHPIKSMELIRPLNRNIKQPSSVSNCNIVNPTLKLFKEKQPGQINKRKPRQPLKLTPSQPVLLNNNKADKFKTKLETLPLELSLLLEPLKSKQDIKKSPRATKLSMENSKLSKRTVKAKTINPQRTSSAATNTTLQSKSIQSIKSNRPTQSAKTNKSTSSSSLSGWKSPFKTFITTGVRTHKSLYGCPESPEFSYDLSRDELKCWGNFKGPMKPAPQQERQLLTNGQRIEYLTQRYEHSPHNKYNYPEATSWRIGWLQQQQLQQKQQQQHAGMGEKMKNLNL